MKQPVSSRRDRAAGRPLGCCADSARIQKKAQETKVALSLKETPVDKALDTICAMGGITIRKVDVPQKPRNVVTAELRGVSVLDGVTTVTKMAGLTFEVVDDGIEVSGQLSNVKKAAMACTMFANDHGGLLPSKMAELWPYLRLESYTPKMIASCDHV